MRVDREETRLRLWSENLDVRIGRIALVRYSKADKLIEIASCICLYL